MGKTRRLESRRRQKEEEALHGVRPAASGIAKSKADIRRDFLAARAAEAIMRKAPEPVTLVEPVPDLPAEHVLETFDAVATELLSIAVPAKKRPAAPRPELDGQAAAQPRADAADADGDIDLARPLPRPKRRTKAGEKLAKHRLQKQRAKHVKRKRLAARAKPRNR